MCLDAVVFIGKKVHEVLERIVTLVRRLEKMHKIH